MGGQHPRAQAGRPVGGPEEAVPRLAGRGHDRRRPWGVALMGFIRRTPTGRQRACWRDPAGRQRSKTFRTKRGANAFLAEVESALNRGTYVAPDAGRLRFADYGHRWLAGRNDEKATVARD